MELEDEPKEQLDLLLSFTISVPGGTGKVIYDGPNRFPESCVEYTVFRSFPLQQMFAYLREKELMLQLDVKRYQDFPREWEVRKARLHEVESNLSWMVQHATGDLVESKRRRNGLW